MAGYWSSVVSQMASPTVRNSTTQPQGLGVSPAAPLLPISVSTLRPCCLTGWCWWQGDTMVIYTVLQTRNCTIRLRELGRSQPASIKLGASTQRRYSPAASCLSPVELATTSFSRVRKRSLQVVKPSRRQRQLRPQRQLQLLLQRRRLDKFTSPAGG